MILDKKKVKALLMNSNKNKNFITKKIKKKLLMKNIMRAYYK